MRPRQETGTNATEILNLIKAALQTLGQEEPAETLPAKDYIHRNRPDGILYDLSHDGAALGFGREAGFDHAARYVKAWGQWLMRDGARWEPDEKLLHMTLIRQHLRNKAEAILLHAFERRERAVENGSESAITEAEKHLDVARKVELRLRDKAFVSAVAEFARSNPASAAAPSAFEKPRCAGYAQRLRVPEIGQTGTRRPKGQHYQDNGHHSRSDGHKANTVA